MRSSISTEILKFIEEENAVCDMTKLYEYFSNTLGYQKYQIHNIRYDKNILYYSEGSVVHFNALEWTSEKQSVLEALAESHLHDRHTAGKPFGLIEHLYDYQYDQLPALPDQIPWTKSLIAELLSRAEKYRIIGTQRNAFVSISNSFGIETLDDLLSILLAEPEYGGAANILSFTEDMRKAGILVKTLSQTMLGDNSKVVIDGNVIRLAGLGVHAERT